MTDHEDAGRRPPLSAPIIEANVGGAYWHKGPHDTLPPPDMMGPYMRNRRFRSSRSPVAGRGSSAAASPALQPPST